MSKITRSVGSSAMVLWLYGTAAALLTVGIFLYTKDTIAEQRRMAEARALTQVVTADQYDNELLDDKMVLLSPAALGQHEEAQAYIARQQEKAVAVILPVRVTDGYGGDMKMIVGIKATGDISGVRVLSHTETPGLGDKIDAKKSDWILSFTGRSLTNPNIARWRVKKDGGEFDQFTGATITPRAVVKGVLNALNYFAEHQQRLLMPSSPKEGSATGAVKAQAEVTPSAVHKELNNGGQ